MIEQPKFDDSADLRRLEHARSKDWMEGGEPGYGMWKHMGSGDGVSRHRTN